MDEEQQSGGRSGISVRTMEVVVALIIFILGAIVVFDSYRLGSKWGADGPQSGYFPFYIGILICFSSLGTLAQTFAKKDADRKIFVEWGPLKLVFTVLIPALVYVLFVQYIGIYVASAVYIAVFMVWLGKYSWIKSAVIAIVVNVIFFLMFEVWFKVPLFKGDLDPLRFLGY
jgi:hypothetical protein